MKELTKSIKRKAKELVDDSWRWKKLSTIATGEWHKMLKLEIKKKARKKLLDYLIYTDVFVMRKLYGTLRI